MKKFRDQIGKIISLSNPPARIISIVPSQTELLADLDLDESVVGITKFCVHPTHWYKSKPRIGGTKTLKIGLIKSLAPDLVLANKEENMKEQVEELEKFVPVWTSDVSTIPDAFEMILTVGEITGAAKKAIEVVEKIKSSFYRLQNDNPLLATINTKQQLKTAYVIWKKPLMVAGGDTFIHNMMKLCGFENIFESKNRYPITSFNELKTLDCELLLLSSEPFPFKEKHIVEFKAILPRAQIMLADGEMFSWYGSRLLYAANYFYQLISDVIDRKIDSSSN